MLCAHYVDRFQSSLGGIVTFVRDLAVACTAHGIDTLLVTNDRGDLPDSWNGKGEPAVHETAIPSRSAGRLSSVGLEQAISGLAKADVVHLHGMWDLGNIQIAKRLKSAGKPYIVSIHGMLDHWSMQQKSMKKKAFLKLFASRYLRDAAYLHTTAQGELDQIVDYVGNLRDKMVVVPIPVNLQPFQNLPGPEAARTAFPQIRDDRPRILFLSRLHVKKGLHVLVDAVGLLRDRGTPCQLIIAGPTDNAYASKIQQQCERAGLQEHVEFLGMVRGPEKISLFQCCDVFALPTSQENFGIAIAEAMAAGIPVVTTRGTDIWRELETGGARIVEATPAEFADALQSVFDNTSESRQRAARGREHVMRWLNPARVADAYRQLYRQSIQTAESLTHEHS